MTSAPPFAIVTGASRGLGLLVAQSLAEIGADLVLAARNSVALDRAKESCLDLGARHVVVVALDVAADDAPRQLAELARTADRPIALINNAAIQGPIGPFWSQDGAAFEEAMRVDFLAPVAITRALAPRMISDGVGYVVNVSGGGATGPRPNFTAYGAAKTALVRFTEIAAAELASTGVKINAIAPGAFASGMTRAVAEAGAAAGAREESIASDLLVQADDANARRGAALIRYLVAEEGRAVSGRLISAVWDSWETLHERADALGASDIYTLRRITPGDRGQDWGGA